MRNMLLAAFYALVLTPAAPVSCAATLERATVAGTVFDASDARVPGVSVAVMSAQGAVISESTTNAAGGFEIRDLPEGVGALVVRGGGFEPYRQRLVLKSGGVVTVRVQMQISSLPSSVTVTATRGAVEDVNSAAQVVTIRDSALRWTPRATLGAALEGSPGVMAQQTTYGASSPYLRGLTGYQTLTLMDGVRYNTSIFRSGPNQYLAFIDPSQVERIEAILGPAGASYGSDSLGGAIQVISRQIPYSGGQRPEAHGEASVAGGSADASLAADAHLSLGTRRLAWLMGASERKLNDLRAGGGADSRNAFQRFLGLSEQEVRGLLGNRLQDTGFEQRSLESKLAFRPNSSGTLTFRYLRADMRNVRSYRDQLGGSGRLQARFDPQGVQFGYARFEKRGLWKFDSISGTFSVNSQGDGSILQNSRFTDPVTTDYARVNALGYTVQAATHAGSRHLIVLGAEAYREKVAATRFVHDPVTRITAQERALFPNGSRHNTTGLFVQDSIDLLPGRLRATLGTRYTNVGYRSRASENLDRLGRDMGVVDSRRRFHDLTFNAGLTLNLNERWSVNGLVGRGFRAPNLNDLGAVGLRSLSYDVPAEAVLALGALAGADAGDGSLSTGKPIRKLGAESLINYELGVRYQDRRLYARVHVFDAELHNPVSSRTLLFPAGQVPAAVSGIPVKAIPPVPGQLLQGVVAVTTPLTPRAVKTTINDGQSRYYGGEAILRYSISARWNIEANYGFLAGRDLRPNRPVRRLPPQSGMISLRYLPSGRRLWIQPSVRFAGSQRRLAGGDIDDDRIGASRRRSDIAGFFAAGIVQPHLLPGADGSLGTLDDLFRPTRETLHQIQDRVLPLGSIINGVAVINDAVRVPLYLKTAGWWTGEVVAGMPLTEHFALNLGVMNLLDRNFRVHGSGVDAPGIGVTVAIRYSF